ncbi:hypothetical protein [Lysobacter sp. CA199]|uniref:hypothetical protein n=1 Tax=Lysobacter sp. CA199 TaxID=3455608 RepID=UPI003F8D6BB0
MDVSSKKRTSQVIHLLLKGFGCLVLSATALTIGYLAVGILDYETALVKCDGARSFKNGQTIKSSHLEMTYVRYGPILKLWERGNGTLFTRGGDLYGDFVLWGSVDRFSLYSQTSETEFTLAGTYSVTTGDMLVKFVDSIHGNDSQYVAKCTKQPL